MRKGLRRIHALIGVTAVLVGALPALLPALPSAAATTGGWSQVLAANPSLGRSGQAMAYDPGRGVTVLFGGYNGSSFMGDTWEYNGTAWTQKSPSLSPHARTGAAMAYSPMEHRIVLFGGTFDDKDLHNDMWEWDGTSWVQKTPSTLPSFRTDAAMATDTQRGRLVLFGGFGGGECDPFLTACAPTALSDTWEWDGSKWVQRTGVGTPPARADTALAYDSARGRSVMFGGLDTKLVAHNDTWEYDGTAWKQRATTVQPSARAAYAATYDVAHGRTELIGGCQASGSDPTTWEWDGTAWTQHPEYSYPPNRVDAGAAYDSNRSRTVLEGGVQTYTGCSPYRAAASDTWELSLAPAAAQNLALTVTEPSLPAGAAQVGIAGVPAPRFNALADAPAQSVGGTQVGGIQIGGIGVPLGASQVGGIQIGGILTQGSIPKGGVGLNDILLSSLPAVNWDQVLQGTGLTGPLQTLTLADVMANSTAAARFGALTLSQSGLSTSLLRSISAADILLGTLPLDRLPVPAGYSTWCAYLQATGWAPAQSCSDSVQGGAAGADVDPGVNSILGLDIAGAQIGGIQVGSIQIGGIQIGGIQIGGIPLYSLQVGGINIAATPLAQVLIRNLPNPSAVVDCTRVDCSSTSTQTLGYAASLTPSAILASAHLSDLGSTINNVSIGELLVGLINPADIDWEKLAYDGMQDIAPATSAGLHYHVDFDLPCGPAAPALTISAGLPNGFRYIAGTSSETVGSGSAQAVADPAGASPPLADVADNLTWSTFPTLPCTGQLNGSQHMRLDFQAQPGLDLGTFAASATVTTPQVTSVSGAAPVTVTKNWAAASQGPNNAPVIQPNQLIFDHVNTPTDVEYFAVPVPAEGTQVNLYLSHVAPGADFDLAVFKPQVQSLQSAQIGGIQIGGIQIGGIAPLQDGGLGTNNSSTSLAPDTLQDIPGVDGIQIGGIQMGGIQIGGIQIGGIQLAGVSQTRGNADEQVQLTTGPETGYYLVQVTGYNGSTSVRPFELRVKETPAAPLPVCPPRTFLNPMGVPGTLPSAVPSTTRTLFLVNQQRMDALYGMSATSSMISELNTVAARTDVAGAVLQVDGNEPNQATSAVRDAYTAWDQSPCSVDAANNVVRQINALVAGYRANSSGSNLLPNLKYIVMVGSDEAVPMARRADNTFISNEISETADLNFLLNNNGTTQANALYAAAAQRQFLTDDAYLSLAPIPFGGQELYLPNLAGGRLVESPAEITGQLQAFANAGGVLNPQTAITTGYDFLTSGAQSINSSLGSRLGSSNADGSLISNTWNRNNLLGKVVPQGAGAPDIDALNAHYNHYQLEPAAPVQGTSFTQGDLVSTADLPAAPTSGSPAQFAGHVLFTMGCHGGLNVADTLLPNPTAAQVTKLEDWTQYYAQQQAAVYVANSGYGYADTDTLALSARLMSLFAQRFNDDSLNIGDKLALAKRDYFATMGQYGAYDEKVLEEATLYGLPMYHLAGTATVTPPPAPATTTDSVTGLPIAPISVSPALTRHDTARGTFWGAGPNGDQTESVFYRPIEPSVTVPVTTTQGVAHGAMITGLGTTDVAGVTPALDLPTIDNSAHEPAPNFVDNAFPAEPVHIDRTLTLGAPQQTLVVVAGQYRDQGIQRLITSMNVNVAYSTSTDFVDPLLTNIGATRSGTSATITAHADDNVGVVRVGALYDDGGTWKYVELGNSTGDTWTANVTLANAQDFEYMIEAQDGAGNVGRSTNKAYNFHSNVTTANLPSSLAATGQLAKVALAWTPAVTPSSITGYKVYRGTSSASLSLLTTLGATASSFADTGLANGVTYAYAVAATTGTGDGPLSNLASASTYSLSTPPLAVSAAAAAAGSVTLNWQAPSSPGAPAITSYNVYRAVGGGSFALVATVAGANLTYTDTSLANGTTYSYRVTAVNPVGESPAGGTVTVTTWAVTSAPQNAAAAAGPGRGQVTVTWAAPASNGGTPVTAYNVYGGYKDATGVHLSFLATVDAGTASYVDGAGCDGCTRYYAVAAVNAVGVGPQSAQVNATTYSAPTAPQNLTLSAPAVVTVGEIDLSWQAPTSSGDGHPLQAYRIYRGVNGAAPTLYRSVDGGTTTYHDSGLVVLDSYTYYVTAVNAEGIEGPASNSACAKPSPTGTLLAC